jgi:hypothetical protein
MERRRRGRSRSQPRSKRQEVAAREALRASANGVGVRMQAITQDSICAESSLWLFDKPSLVGNELCFAG